MAETIPLKIYDVVGGPVWVSADDGQKVYDKIVAAFTAHRGVELSFANRGNMITAFLNVAVGQLYNGTYDEAFLRENLLPVDISDDDLVILNRAIENAKRYFANRAAHENAWKEEIGDEE